MGHDLYFKFCRVSIEPNSSIQFPRSNCIRPHHLFGYNNLYLSFGPFPFLFIFAFWISPVFRCVRLGGGGARDR